MTMAREKHDDPPRRHWPPVLPTMVWAFERERPGGPYVTKRLRPEEINEAYLAAETEGKTIQ